MANYSIKIDLLKLQGAFVRTLQGNTGAKQCIIIPIDDCKGMFLGEKGCYLNMTAFALQEPKYKDTHCIKVNIPQELRSNMTKEELNEIPIIGGLHAFDSIKQNVRHPEDVQPIQGAYTPPASNDLPF